MWDFLFVARNLPFGRSFTSLSPLIFLSPSLQVERQALYLFDYSNSLAIILQNFEKGLYPVYEKSGIKAVQIPEKVKPGPIAPDVLKELIKYKKRAEDFMKAHPTAITKTSSAVVAASGDSAQGMDGAAYELQQQLDAMREKLATAEAVASSASIEERAKIEQEVLNDLADHPTVEYIKRIEDERAYYKEQLAEEVCDHAQLLQGISMLWYVIKCYRSRDAKY